MAPYSEEPREAIRDFLNFVKKKSRLKGQSRREGLEGVED